ncbi:MAG: TetR/AcrR family transcriptional regulator [Candidatus Marinimicrobia bacterium]|nr:TetR/AcrR family transcriptional regulator [Candidatus Neomarinimicrobiota bacterium]
MTPIPKDETKRQRIINAAIKIFAEDGVSNGKIAKIAEKAGIGKGTIYEYFSSKEEIFAAVFEDFFSQMMNGYDRLGSTAIDPKTKIEMMFDYTYDSLDEHLASEHAAEWLIFLEIFVQGFRDQLLGHGKLSFSNVLKNMYDLIKPLINEGIKAEIFRTNDADHMTFILFAALDGIGLHYFINRDYYDKEQLKKITKEIFLNGLLTETGKGA